MKLRTVSFNSYIIEKKLPECTFCGESKPLYQEWKDHEAFRHFIAPPPFVDINFWIMFFIQSKVIGIFFIEQQWLTCNNQQQMDA